MFHLLVRLPFAQGLAEEQDFAGRVTQHEVDGFAHLVIADDRSVGANRHDDEVDVAVGSLFDDGLSGLASLDKLTGNVCANGGGDLLGTAQQLLSAARLGLHLGSEGERPEDFDDVEHGNASLSLARDERGETNGFEAGR